MASNESADGIVYLHSVLAQTQLPYRNPGEAVREWRRYNGNVVLLMKAGDKTDYQEKDFVPVGLPYGPKARLIMAHLSTQALITGRPEIEVEDTLTRFVTSSLGMEPYGRNINAVKEQMMRLATCQIKLGLFLEDRAVQINSHLVDEFEMWHKNDEGKLQRKLWPNTIKLSPRYFESLQSHAVPLGENHLRDLGHSAMALDIYCWLAQRLHRVDGTALVPWANLHEQFGMGVQKSFKFRQVFRVALKQVLTVYKTAKVEDGPKGLILRTSPTPVPRRALPGA